MSNTPTSTQTGSAAGMESATVSHRSVPAPAAPAPRVPAPPTAPPAPAAQAPASDTMPVELIVRQDQGQDQGQPAAQRQPEPERTGVPAGPLLLSAANGLGLAGTTAYSAAGVAGAVVLGGAVTAAGAVAGAVALRNGRRYGRYGLGWRGARGYGAGGYRSGGYGRAGGGYRPVSGRAGYASGPGLFGAGRRGSRAATGTAASPSAGRVGPRGSGPAGRSGRTSAPSTGAPAPGRGRSAPVSLTKSPTGTGRSGAGAPRPHTGTGTGLGRAGRGRPGMGWGSRLNPRLLRRRNRDAAKNDRNKHADSSVGDRVGKGTDTTAAKAGRGRARRTIAAALRRTGALAALGAARRLGGRLWRSAAPWAGTALRGLDKARRAFPGALTEWTQAAIRRWKKSAKRRRALRARLRLARRVAVTTVLSVAVATLTQILWPFRFHAARTWRRIWNWRALRSQRKETKLLARAAAKDAADNRPEIKDTVTRPERETDTKTTTGGSAGTTNGGAAVRVFERAAEQVAAAYSRYSPPHMLSVAAEYEGVPEGIRHAAQALAQLCRNTREVYPAHAAVAEAVSHAYMRMMQAADTADEIAPHFRRVHEADLERHEAPRNGWTGEVMWNIGGSRGDTGERQSVFARSAEQVSTVYARWTPSVMTEVLEEYTSIPAGIDHLARAIDSLAVQSADAYPVDPSVAEMVAAVRHRLSLAESAAQEIMPLFRRVHEADLRRHEAPRNGAAAEAMWNV